MSERSAEIVDCGSCSACCHQIVVLMPEETGEGLIFDEIGGQRVLRHRKNGGGCVHLVGGRCSVWAQRPAVCRVFHCGKWALRLSRSMRKQIRRHGDEHDRRQLAEGDRRALALR